MSLPNFKKGVLSISASLVLFSSLLVPMLGVVSTAEASTSCASGNAVALRGVTIDAGSSATSDYAIGIFQNDFNMNTVRLWQSIPANLDVATSGEKTVVLAKKLHDLGFKVMVVFSYKGTTVPSYNQLFNYFTSYYDKYNDRIDYWEMQNEPGTQKDKQGNIVHPYWPGSLTEYLNNFQKAGWDALHPHGAYVISGAIAGNAYDLQVLLDKGLLEITDGVAFHPYGDNGTVDQRRVEHINKVQTVSDSITNKLAEYKAKGKNLGNKPLFITEWNIHFSYRDADGNTHTKDPEGWASQFDNMYAGIKGCVSGIWYYHSLVDPRAAAGPAAIFTKDSTKKLIANQPFYSAVRKVYTTNPYGGPLPIGSGDGNNPQGTPSPSPSPSRSPSPSPSPSNSPKVSPTVSPSVSPKVSPSVTPSPTNTNNPDYPAPTVSSTCAAGATTPTIFVSWNGSNPSSTGYNVNITTNKSLGDGGWFFNTNKDSLVVSSFSQFSNFGGMQRPALQPNTTYKINVLYIPSGKTSQVATVTSAKCNPIIEQPKQTVSEAVTTSTSGIPAPVVTATCPAIGINPTLNFTLEDKGATEKGYNINLANDQAFSNGGWFVNSKNVSYTTANFSAFSKFGNGVKPASINPNTTYYVNALYISLGKVTGVAKITTPDCKATVSSSMGGSLFAAVINSFSTIGSWIGQLFQSVTGK